MSPVHALSSLVRLVTSLRGGISGAVCHCEKLMVYRVVCYDIEETPSVQDEENGPQY